MSYRIVKEEPETEKVAYVRKDTSYRKVFVLFKNPWPANWNIRKVEIQAAQNLLVERGEKEIKDALQFIKDYGDKKIGLRECPEIHSPYDLDSKWDKLQSFSDKLTKIL